MVNFKVIIFLLISASAHAQLTDLTAIWKDHEYSGEQLFKEGLYEAAIVSFEAQHVQDENNTQVIIRLAESYMHLGNYKEAEHYFNILGKSYELDKAYFEEYANVLLANGKREEALAYYNQIIEINPENKVPRAKIQGIKEWESFFQDEAYMKISEVPFNTADAEYGIRRYGKSLGFTSSRIKDQIIQHNYMREESKLTSIYTVVYDSDKTNEPAILEIDDFRKRNDGPYSEFGSLYAISRSQENIANQAHLGIFFYEMDSSNRITYAYNFPFNSPTYSVTHPAFSEKGDTLFFASNMQAGFGGYDLYYSVYRNNLWSSPVNMGEPINTSKNELFPYSDKGNLYFSSEGHAGIGGLDTYKVVHKKRDILIENLGSPINSGWDDFAIFVNGMHGFISSNRPGGKGLDDIYEFFVEDKPKVIEPVDVNISILDNLNEIPVTDATVLVISSNDTLEVQSNELGEINEKLMPGDYAVMVTREPYVDFSFRVTIEEDNAIKQMVRLEPAMAIHVVSPDSIMFKFGEYSLLHKLADQELDDIVQTLLDYPEFNLEISAHTDARGTHDYNIWLSERRAETAANYIIGKGIDTSRIHSYGYGETRLLNNCRDGVRCSDDLHAVNRRIEFDFIRKESEED